MEKKYYEKLINERPWQWVNEHFKSLRKFVPSKIAMCKINPQDWIDFTVKYFHLAQQNTEIPKPHYDPFAKKLATLNNTVGRNEHNTFELSYGYDGNANELMIEMFGKENLELLNLRSDYLVLRLLVKMPGHGVAWHVDHLKSYTKKFKNQLKIDPETFKCQYGQIARLWLPVTNWENGHIFQISETILSNWRAGDVYHIPFGLGHCSGNAGYVPQYSLAITGVIKQDN